MRKSVRQVNAAGGGTSGAADLHDKVIMITGASRGLGRAMAEGLARRGAMLVLIARAGSEATMQATLDCIAAAQPDCPTLALYGDISNDNDCARFVHDARARFGRLDALINNAGQGMDAAGALAAGKRRFDQIDPALWRSMIDININGTWLMTRAALPGMLEQGWGRIINLSTSYATMTKPGFAPYGPSKAAVESMTVIWARELEGSGVTANLLLPGGGSDTDMMPAQDWPDRSLLIPPVAMVAPAAWLCSDASRAVTGMRVVAKSWDATLPDDQAAAAAIAPGAW
ncbi:MAG: SDR family oxidoreductase [Pseudomonadota bacterium]